MLEDLIHERKKKLEEYQKVKSAYPSRVKRTHKIILYLSDFEKLKKSQKKIFIVGRLESLRDQGGIIFADIIDETGKAQIVLNKKIIKEFNFLQKTFEAGDFVEVGGTCFVTKRGEKSILVKNANIISKSILPLPTKWYGIEDMEMRLRKRYLDLLFHNDIKDLFIKKSIFWDSIRSFLKENGYLEVETPVLESIPGGAEARPFITHHNALDEDLYLRISLELPLKKLLVGGFEKVFEIGRIFRNEGIDREHLQDYTQMECYAAYENYEDMMKFVEKMYKFAIKRTFGKLLLKSNGKLINWGKKWTKVDYYTEFKKQTGIDLKSVSLAELQKKAKELKIVFDSAAQRGRIIDLIYKKAMRPNLIEPCFLVDPPVDIEPLAKRLEKDKSRVARFQILALGTELGKGFSELNDPIDQRLRFNEQMKLREGGDEEAQMLDEGFLEALEYGMPPASGFGMSERLFAVLSDKPVREAVIFPLMKKEDGANKQ